MKKTNFVLSAEDFAVVNSLFTFMLSTSDVDVSMKNRIRKLAKNFRVSGSVVKLSAGDFYALQKIFVTRFQYYDMGLSERIRFQKTLSRFVCQRKQHRKGNVVFIPQEDTFWSSTLDKVRGVVSLFVF